MVAGIAVAVAQCATKPIHPPRNCTAAHKHKSRPHFTPIPIQNGQPARLKEYYTHSIIPPSTAYRKSRRKSTIYLPAFWQSIKGEPPRLPTVRASLQLTHRTGVRPLTPLATAQALQLHLTATMPATLQITTSTKVCWLVGGMRAYC